MCIIPEIIEWSSFLWSEVIFFDAKNIKTKCTAQKLQNVKKVAIMRKVEKYIKSIRLFAAVVGNSNISKVCRSTCIGVPGSQEIVFQYNETAQ